uniref:Uncharacterized protein n=1 Tax=uncultured marine crenarchaeote HF4000_APKG8I13 TaxID=455606 RepID=B3TB07_9ARCH|nr:hypothetical protein ALOHA_HF4000APKG8I13ctg1g36 [uncultured marine crenarchaeote HF4000_APKG8I13]
MSPKLAVSFSFRTSRNTTPILHFMQYTGTKTCPITLLKYQTYNTTVLLGQVLSGRDS